MSDCLSSQAFCHFDFVRLLRYAYLRIGLDSRVAMLVLLGSLLGSYINIPVAQLPEAPIASDEVIDFFGMRYIVPGVTGWSGTIIAVNVGGAVIPTLLSIYLLARNQIWLLGGVGTVIVAVVVHRLAYMVPGVGIAVPVVAPPRHGGRGDRFVAAFRRAARLHQRQPRHLDRRRSGQSR